MNNSYAGPSSASADASATRRNSKRPKCMHLFPFQSLDLLLFLFFLRFDSSQWSLFDFSFLFSGFFFLNLIRVLDFCFLVIILVCEFIYNVVCVLVFSDSKFTQQELPACKPILTPQWVRKPRNNAGTLEFGCICVVLIAGFVAGDFCFHPHWIDLCSHWCCFAVCFQ